MIPQFCPNPDCVHHLPSLTPSTDTWWVKLGHYRTKVVGPVQRYLCLACRHSFSDRSFSLDYYTKKTICYQEVFTRNCSGEWPSAMSRNLHCSANSIQNRLERLGRNCLAAHAELVRQIILREDLVADGFESFDVSQYHPNNINLLCGKDSQFLYSFTHSSLNRKGRMTEEQKLKAKELKKAKRGTLGRDFARLLAHIEELWDQPSRPSLSLYTDMHPAYPGAILANPRLREALAHGSLHHERISSEEPRTILNPLFSVNYMDRELRKDGAAYHRETTCFTRNVSNGLHRLAVYQFWHNYRKPFRIKKKEKRDLVHAEAAGLPRSVIEACFEDLFTRRRFITHERLSVEGASIWRRAIATPEKKKPELLPKYAIRGYHQAS